MRTFRASLLALSACGRWGFDDLSRADAVVDTTFDAPPGMLARVAMAEYPETPPGASVDVTLPAGLAVDDVVLLAIYCDYSTAQLTIPGDWFAHFDMTDASNMFHASFLSHRVAPGDPATASFPVTGAGSIAWGLAAYRGVTAFDADATMFATATLNIGTETFDVPSVTTGGDGELVVVMMINDGGYGTGSWSAPAGMATFADALRIGGFDRTFSVAGATGTFTATITPSTTAGSRGATWAVALAR